MCVLEHTHTHTNTPGRSACLEHREWALYGGKPAVRGLGQFAAERERTRTHTGVRDVTAVRRARARARYLKLNVSLCARARVNERKIKQNLAFSTAQVWFGRVRALTR